MALTAKTTTPEAPAAWSPADLQANPHAAPDKARRVQSMFSGIAQKYDLNNRLHSFGRDQFWRRRAVRLANVQPGDDVLDIACGTGDLTLAFADANPPPRSITGLDFTEEMLIIAREKSLRRSVHSSKIQNPKSKVPPATFLHGDAMNLPFEDHSFNIVSIAFGIRNVSDPAHALREFHRVLKPGGRLVVLEFSQPQNPILRWINRIYTGTIMPLTATLIARDRSGAYRYLPKSVATFPEGAAFCDLLKSCGFTQIEAQPMTFGVCTAYTARPGSRLTGQ